MQAVGGGFQDDGSYFLGDHAVLPDGVMSLLRTKSEVVYDPIDDGER
jgi:hypothetical protein